MWKYDVDYTMTKYIRIPLRMIKISLDFINKEVVSWVNVSKPVGKSVRVALQVPWDVFLHVSYSINIITSCLPTPVTHKIIWIWNRLNVVSVIPIHHNIFFLPNWSWLTIETDRFFKKVKFTDPKKVNCQPINVLLANV